MAQENIAKWSVSAVARSAEQDVFAIDFSREKHAIAIEGHQRVLHFNEGLEVLGVTHADRRSFEIVAPSDVVGIVDLHDPWIVSVGVRFRISRFVDPFDQFVFQLPADRVVARSEVKPSPAGFTVDSEDSDETVAIGDDSAIVGTGSARDRVPADNWVLAGPPNGIATAMRPVFPWQGREGVADNGWGV